MTTVYAWDGEAVSRALEELRRFAEEPTHHYRPSGDAQIPGYDKRFVRHVRITDAVRGPNDLRFVFTVTINLDGTPWRHASVSARKGEPPVHVVGALLPLLGFRGSFADWEVARGQAGSPNDGAWIVAQALGAT